MEREFYSNGKLLITGEYAVLDGAKAWAIPTKYGQSLTVIETESKKIEWKSLDEKEKVWFEAIYDLESMTVISSSSSEIATTLLEIFIEAQKLNPRFLTDGLGYALESKLTFPRDWGLGSSSTLINRTFLAFNALNGAILRPPATTAHISKSRFDLPTPPAAFITAVMSSAIQSSIIYFLSGGFVLNQYSRSAK